MSKLIISPYQVLMSNAGYYVGRLCHEGDEFWMPYDRISGYYRDKKQALLFLELCKEEA